MEYLTFTMNKWYEIEKYCKYLSCIAPNCLGKKNKTISITSSLNMLNVKKQLEMEYPEIRLPLLNLLVLFEKYFSNLIDDYNEFLQPLFPNDSDDTFVGICAKYQLYKTICVIKRLADAICEFLNNSNLGDVKLSLAYFAKTLLPRQNLYHDKNQIPMVVSGKLNFLYYLGFCSYLDNLIYPASISTDNRGFDLGIPLNNLTDFSVSSIEDLLDINIVSHNYLLNNLLKWSAEISSYPITPPDLMGHLISTTDKRKGKLDLLDPGYDNSSHQKNFSEPSVCLHCKFLNLSVGQTDDVEQRESLKCSCLHKEGNIYSHEDDVYREEESLLDNLTSMNAQTFLHLLFLSKPDLIPSHYGCRCIEHKALFSNWVKKYYELLLTLQIVNVSDISY